MNTHINRIGLAVSGVALLVAAGCGGGGGDDTPAAPVATTTNVSITVIDGAIKDATVCLDKSGDGKCDADEVPGKTDAAGNVTLAVPNADVGKYPVLAVVGADAVDAVHGRVTVAYAMSAPADQTGVVSPLTTLVQQTIASTGVSTAEAAKSVQDVTGITTSLFQDYTKPDGNVSAATLARLLVVTTQQQQTAVAGTLGTKAIDDSIITQANLDKAIQKKLLELLPDLMTALGSPAVVAAVTANDPAAKETALQAAATVLVADAGLTPAALPTVVAINNQLTMTAPAATPSAFVQLTSLGFTDAANFNVRLFTGSLAQNTPDAGGNTRFIDRRVRSVGGNIATWGAGNDPWRGADLHWNGSAWANCPINHENMSSVRDAKGNGVYNYCDGRETGKSNRAAFEVSGKAMADVYAQVRAAGYTNLSIADPAAALGTAAFPTGSLVLYQTSTPLTSAIAYYPGGANSPAGTSNIASQYSPAVSAGGVASAQAAGTGCNSDEANKTNGTSSTTLEGLIAAKTGTPCVYGPGSFVYGGATYTSGDKNEWWSNSTVSLGKIGTAPVGSGPAPGFYTTNTLLRVAFQGSGTNPVTYYACKERFNNGSTRNCGAPIGTGTYTITTLGDARVMTLSNPPPQAAALTYNRVFVERGGFVYLGYQSKPSVNGSARLNTVAANALLTQLGVPAIDPDVPLALTAGSYTGTWDVRDSTTPVSPTNGTTVFINANGSVSCQDRETGVFETCAVTFSDLSAGSFSYTNGGTTASGSLNFLAGTASGTYHDPASTPADGSFLGGRR